LQQSNRSEKRRIINIIKNKSDEPNQVQLVLDFVRQSGGLTYAETQMKRYQEEAFNLIANLGSDTHRIHLEDLVRYTTQRTS
jgi:octaprenyl-diphosphate synthase